MMNRARSTFPKKNVFARIRTLLLGSNVLGKDETPVRLQDPSLPGKMRTARMWLC